MVINGKAIAQTITDELAACIQETGVTHTLHILIVGNNPVIEGFVTRKRHLAKVLGVQFIEHRFAESVTTQELVQAIGELPQPCGVVVQLPLPAHIDTDAVLAAVPHEADIDGLTPDSPYLPPVAAAVREILEHECITVNGKNALVVGKGRLVGVPVTRLLNSLGAIVTTVDHTLSHGDLVAVAKKSDIIISGAGVPRLITPDMLQPHVVLIDAGTSTQAGVTVGDIAHECEPLASVFARTPGGIGPITIAVLFKNLIYGTIGGHTLG